jgi:hypothetical protein
MFGRILESLAEQIAASRMPTLFAVLREMAQMPDDPGRYPDIYAIHTSEEAARKRIEALGAHLEAGGVRAGKAGEVLRLMQEKVRLERSMKRHAFFGRLLKRYRMVHVIASDIMFGALLLHIIVSLAFAVGN